MTHLPPPLPVEDDLVLLLTALWADANESILSRLARRGFGDLRQSHGYLIQHLVPGPVSVTALAQRLGVTQQAASKAVAELERMGYVQRDVPRHDQRTRMVALTDRGARAVAATREERANVNAALLRRLGGAADGVVTSLRGLATATGAISRLAERRLRPPR